MSDHVSLLIYLNFESTDISKLPKRMYYNGNDILMNEFFNGFQSTLLLDALNTQECWDLFTDKVDYAIEKFIPINDNNKSTSKDWVNSKVRYERKKTKKTGMVKTMEKIKSNRTHCIQNNNCILENPLKLMTLPGLNMNQG